MEHLERHGEHLPAWAWMNLLAHATDDQLLGAGARAPRPSRRPSVWRQARSYLVGEVLNTVARCGPLTSLQTDVLVPLELELMAGSRFDEYSPAEWVTRVLAALRDYERTKLQRD